jgi:murein DD-endopeptidase MepM/ murein hydrolase activator NlpD
MPRAIAAATAIDLRQLYQRDPEAAQIAHSLNQHPALNFDGDPLRLRKDEWEAALRNPYVTPQAKQVLARLSGEFDQGLALPGLPAERAQVRRALAQKGVPVFEGRYPAEVAMPPEVARMDLRFPFPEGEVLYCQQGHNTMAASTSHAPEGLRYSLDFCAQDETEGLPILSTAPGTAYVYDQARVNHPDNWGLGKVVLVDHKNGYATLLAHLRDVAVKTGQRVRAGQKVGSLGTTGSAGNAHLHMQMVRLLRQPDPAKEQQRREFSDPFAPAPPMPFEPAGVPFHLFAENVSRNEPAQRLPTALFRGGEAGALIEYGERYRGRS